ncbi:hypothetical protein HIM_07728 [Hirsutella minnesotensis 3608]|uniref:DUF4045 domain-containing protein n=1 Tax=Hirsutella minnesotensis 3608 TaxID=1043627 RepID=A0A0F7ZN16_9HYPO|nr:hypothetical protein HIM_07728 [Hirsutella minnesotensis 3608]
MSDEVSQFLEQVERLRGQQVEDDEVRARELQEFLAAKRERQARREERARSISPQKSSPVNTPSPEASRRSVHLSEAVKLGSPVAVRESSSADLHSDPSRSPPSSSPTKENEAPLDASEARLADAALSSPKSAGMSWQKRPGSRAGRPLSMVAAENATQRSFAGAEPASATEQTFSMDQIAQSLGSKDPAWFRQTADRGLGSAALRRRQVEDDDRLDMPSVKAQLPGMTPDEPDQRPSSRHGLTSPVRLGSPLSLTSSREGASADDKASAEQTITSPTGRTSPLRASSPTKGMGGFVQSAMMKRSDSVKRWSVTSPPGLSRADSVAASRSSHERGSSQSRSRPQSLIRSGSPRPGSSRPTSKHGETEETQETAPDTAPAGEHADSDAAVKDKEEDTGRPVSPSKTMDPRRWSPTKSSWLENALKKPESPKAPPKPAQSQPAWMVELNKAKAERANTVGADSLRPGGVTHKHQVSIGGLMRQSPVGEAAKPNPTGLGGIYSPPPKTNNPITSHKSVPSNGEKPSQDENASTAERRLPAASSPPEPKPKPEAPPTMDFRSSLRQRPVDNEAPKAHEPEFKNVFGNLRRTKTQNYVAPDELKNNILRGKAALNVTDGPRKGERKDEFKEAILKKRDDFKKAQAEGKGITRKTSTAADKPVPEGLAKRATLGRSSTGSRSENSLDTGAQDEVKGPVSPKRPTEAKRASSQAASSPRSPQATRTVSRSPGPEKVGRPSSEIEAAEPVPQSPASPSPRKDAAPRPQPQRASGSGSSGKLGDRFNSALAGMLARGPPAMATSGSQGSDGSGPHRSSTGGDASEPTGPGPQLTHVTKNRARGPKRKAPSAASVAPASASGVSPAAATPAPSESAVPEKPASPVTISPVAERGQSEHAGSKQEPQETGPSSPLEAKETPESPVSAKKKPAPLSIQQQVAAQAALRGHSSPLKSDDKSSEALSSAGAASPSLLRKRPSSPLKSAEGTSSSPTVSKTGSEAPSQPGSPRKLDMKRMSKFFDETPTDKSLGSPKEPIVLAHRRTGSTSPIKSPQRSSQEPIVSPAKSNGGSLPSAKSLSSAKDSMANSPRLPTPLKSPSTGADAPSPINASPEMTSPKPESSGAARPLPSLPREGFKSSSTLASPMRSPTKGVNEVSTILTDFFGPERPKADFKVDPAEILMNRPPSGAKVSSSGFQIFKIFGDGKKVPVSAQDERLLFEQEMYVCAHNFTDASGKKAFEVYFWVGDEVPEATAEDAHVFVQREARTLGGTLVKLRQGKETAEFIQALGGVIIVRRGSSNKYDSLAPSMLCGRRYLGQVAFDEVDFTPANLCSGFTYVIAQAGTCVLWKGKGSDVTEVSCARLVGMDLTLTGELAEYDDGEEPAAFWELFGSDSLKPHSADHWRLKPNYEKYCGRLFCSDANAKQQITELNPFNQADLGQDGIYVLDAFFEMYIVVGARANAHYASFRNALDFAQEYAILAAGIEDRPFVPVSTVVLEGIPRDLKRVFRKWTDEQTPPSL